MKQKSTIFLLFLLLFSLIGSTVEAYTGEIDPENYISLPLSLMTVNKKATATISTSASGYDIYYQKVDLTENLFNSIINKGEELKKYQTDTKKELDDKKEEVTELQNTYKELLKDAIATNSIANEAEIEEAKTKYETALEEYKKAVETADAKSKELREKWLELVPTYTNSWTKTTNDSSNMTLDFTGYSGKVYFVLWAKIDNGTNTYYDFSIYSNDIKASETEEPKNETKVENEINTVKENDKQNEVADNTQADGKLPQTGYNMLMGVGIILTIGIAGFVSYCKTKKYDL